MASWYPSSPIRSAARRSLLDLPGQYGELALTMRDRLNDDFAALGLLLTNFYVNAITPTDETSKAIDERAAMGAIGDLDAYVKFKAARALGDSQQSGRRSEAEASGWAPVSGWAPALRACLARRSGRAARLNRLSRSRPRKLHLPLVAHAPAGRGGDRRARSALLKRRGLRGCVQPADAEMGTTPGRNGWLEQPLSTGNCVAPTWRQAVNVAPQETQRTPEIV